MDILQNFLFSLFDITSIWSVVFRTFIWVVIAILILAATDNPKNKKIKSDTKSYLGMFLMVVILSSSLIYLLFGLTPQ